MRRLYLHVFAEGARVCVGLVAHFAEIRFVRRVDVHVFLAVTAVCKPPVAAFEFTLKRLLACTRTWTKHTLENHSYLTAHHGEYLRQQYYTRLWLIYFTGL